jgi:MFS family permease
MRSLFGHRDFRLLLFGQGASTIGDRLVFVALAIYVTDIGTPSDVGIVLACHAVPLVGFLLIGGVWADRLPRHLVVVVTDLIRFGLHALLATLIFTGAVEIWHIAVIEACFGTAEAFFRRAPRWGRSRPSPSSPGRRWPPRSCSAWARAGRSRSTPRPSWSRPRS